MIVIINLATEITEDTEQVLFKQYLCALCGKQEQ